MTLIKDRRVAIDPFRRIGADESLPAEGALLVPLTVWQDQWERLVCRREPVGVQLASHEHPEIIGDDVDQLDLIALEFPTFRDGRAYSCARLIRERYGFTGELRAVGDVLLEQLHYMERVGFNAFEFISDDPLIDFEIAANDFTVWYQAAGDDRRPAPVLRQTIKCDG
jgi:uncharacterized protein (DUF934 family)